MPKSINISIQLQGICTHGIEGRGSLVVDDGYLTVGELNE